ncbi:MAG: hypothetical protein ABIE03_06170 [Patescibacteria group bacterium]|nr:hypothetical protein [Patescibacteria group bacterium]
MKYIAYCTKGTEPVVKGELLKRIKDAKIFEEADKRIIFGTKARIEDLTKLRCPDDIGILIGEFTASSTQDFSKKILSSDFSSVLVAIHPIRKDLKPKFSITLGGVTGLDLAEYTDKIIPELSQVTGFKFEEKDHSNFDIRIFVDEKKFYVSVRITKLPLYKREYKEFEKEGSLKPSIAACMVYSTTGGESGLKIVDNFCGSGTILCEALATGNSVCGGDVDSESVGFTLKNLENSKLKTLRQRRLPAQTGTMPRGRQANLWLESSNLKVEVKILNATKTSWPNNFFDCAVSNLPYGKQVKVSNITTLYRDALKEYARIVRPSGTICLLGTRPEIIKKYAKEYLKISKIEEFKLGFLGQMPTLQVIRK